MCWAVYGRISDTTVSIVHFYPPEFASLHAEAAKLFCITRKVFKTKTDKNKLIAKELSWKRSAAPITVEVIGPSNLSVSYLSYCLGKTWGYRSPVDRHAFLAVWFLTSSLQKVQVIDRLVSLYVPVLQWLALNSDTRPVVATICITNQCTFKAIPNLGQTLYTRELNWDIVSTLLPTIQIVQKEKLYHSAWNAAATWGYGNTCLKLLVHFLLWK